MHRPHEHPDVKSGRIGILLINLGSPDDTSFWPVRRYLKEFLSDPRVVEARGPVWWLIFNGIILTKRPVSLGEAYKKIWNRQTDEAPLKIITRKQAESLAERFAGTDTVEVDWAMRYGQPSIDERMTALREAGCDRIVAFPLYPHYSAATTATVNDKVFESLMKTRFMPAVRTVPSYHDEPVYIEAIARSIEKNGWPKASLTQ